MTTTCPLTKFFSRGKAILLMKRSLPLETYVFETFVLIYSFGSVYFPPLC